MSSSAGRSLGIGLGDQLGVRQPLDGRVLSTRARRVASRVIAKAIQLTQIQ